MTLSRDLIDIDPGRFGPGDDVEPGPVVSPLALPGSRNPTGWFQVAWSDELPPGGVKLVHYFGRDIVLWRGESGRLNAADAYCLHLGGNLGVKGTVCGEDIVCPWHHWQWNGEGANTLIPYSQQRCKPNLRLEVWPAVDWCGCILVWHDRAGSGPTWQPPTLPEMDDGSVYPITDDMRVCHRIKAHPQIVFENGADAAHVSYIHGAGLVPNIERVETEGHTWRAEISAVYGAGKESTWLTPDGPVEVQLELNLWGIGLGAARWPAELMGGLQITCVTPVDDVYSDYFFMMTTARRPDHENEPSPAARKLIEHQLAIIEQDFFTWENMKVLHTPNFAPEEAKHYATLRRWAWQFYPEGPRPPHLTDSGTHQRR